ncbi:Armadillo-type fold [Phaffia rhodozyma]|uniref:Pre-rRNA-processing protein RIX1 n=1 Tax=Phaffia rhodozyma TaxID=264483 RepID=A0A0F7SSB5_PHARH|nr:Armadillo-type fold [Phaffia rhodozyma]
MSDPASLLAFLGSTLSHPGFLSQTVSLIEIHAPFHPEVLPKIPSSVLTSFLKALDALILSKEEANRLAGWSIGAIVMDQSRASAEILDRFGRNWVVGLMGIVGKQLASHLIGPFVRLLSSIFLNSGSSNPQFHREITLPNLQKYTLNLLVWTEKFPLVALPPILPFLSHLVALHPPSVRALHASLLSTSLAGLSTAQHPSTRQAAVKLYTSLHLLPGKSASPQAFVHDLQSALTSAHECLDALFQGVFEEQAGGRQARDDIGELGIKWKGFTELAKERDSLKKRSVALERLDGFVRLVTGMLRQPTSRGVAIPAGTVLALPYRILRITSDGLMADHANPEESNLVKVMLPQLYILACGLLGQLTLCSGQALLPHQMEIVSYLVYLLEKTAHQPKLHQALLKTLSLVLSKIGPLAPIHAVSGSLTGRIVKIALTNLGELLEPSRVAALSASQEDPSSSNGGSKGKGKKRSHAESNSLALTSSLPALAASVVPTAMLSIELLSAILPHPALQPALYVLATKVLLSLSINLPVSARRQAGGHSAQAWAQLEDGVKKLLVDGLSSGPSAREGTVGPEAGWVVQSLNEGGKDSTLGSLLHPLLPALPRPLPAASSLLLYKSEGRTEQTNRESLSFDTLSTAQLGPTSVPVEPMLDLSAPLNTLIENIVPTETNVSLSASMSATLPTTIPPTITSAPFETAFVQPSQSSVFDPPVEVAEVQEKDETMTVPASIALKDSQVAQKMAAEEQERTRAREQARVSQFQARDNVGGDDDDDDDGEIPEIDMGDDTSEEED